MRIITTCFRLFDVLFSLLFYSALVRSLLSLSLSSYYLAPEIFECALDIKPGYSFPADWWSLGVCAYEMLWGHRPHDIHSVTPLDQVLALQQKEELELPQHVSDSFAHLIQRLLCYNASERVSSIGDLQSRCSYCKNVDFEAIFNKKVEPKYVPPKNQLNCDPTFELEEMIIEANPLHKKKKRLSKQHSVSARKALEHQGSSSLSEPGATVDEKSAMVQSCLNAIHHEFIIYNRHK